MPLLLSYRARNPPLTKIVCAVWPYVNTLGYILEGRTPFRTIVSAPYSYDLRQKAIDAVKGGERKSDVCRMFNLSRNTLDLWLKRVEQTGDYQAITHFQKGYQHKSTDWKRFEEFVQKHGGKTQRQMATLWGDNVTQQNISDALMKLGLSRKKRLTDM